MAITNEKELNEALQNGVDSIEIEGNLKDKVIRIKASGKVAWIVAFGAIAMLVIIAVFSIKNANILLMVSHNQGTKIGAIMMIGAVVVAVIAIAIALLNRFRKYKLEKVSSTRIVLRKK